MKKTISLVLSLVMLLSVMSFGTQAFAAGYVADSDARAMLDLVNDFRTGSDAWYYKDNTKTDKVFVTRQKLTYDENLEKIAKQRAQEIVELFDHERPDGSMYYDIKVKDAKGNEINSYGENIACGDGMTAEGAFNAWLEIDCDKDHQYHRRNMLSVNLDYPDAIFTTIGIAGFVADNGKTYWVQEFGYGLSAQSGEGIGSQAVTKPAKTAIKTIKGAKKAIKLSWKKVTKNNTGYEIQIATNKKFTKNKKTVTVKSAKTTSKTIKKLKAKKKYFVRVRCYRTVDGKKYYSKWSAVKNVKTKG